MRFRTRESYIDQNDPRDFGGMTFDLSTEPDAELLLALPEEESKSAPDQYIAPQSEQTIPEVQAAPKPAIEPRPDNGWSGFWD